MLYRICSLYPIMTMAFVLDRGLSLLEDPQDVQAAGQLYLEVNQWSTAIYSDPARTTPHIQVAGAVLASLASYAASAAVSSLMCETAMQQLKGKRALGDWSPVQEVNQHIMKRPNCCHL